MTKRNIVDDKTSKTIFQERMNAEALKARTPEQKKLAEERMKKINKNRRRQGSAIDRAKRVQYI